MNPLRRFLRHILPLPSTSQGWIDRYSDYYIRKTEILKERHGPLVAHVDDCGTLFVTFRDRSLPRLRIDYEDVVNEH